MPGKYCETNELHTYDLPHEKCEYGRCLVRHPREERPVGDTADYTVQPPPAVVEGGVSSHDLACADIASWPDAELAGPVIELLQERKAYGLEKYEVILHKDNERDIRKDALDEATDLVVYLRTWADQELSMRPMIVPLYQMALWTLAVLVAIRDGRRVPHTYERYVFPLVEIEDLREGTEINVQ